MNDEEEKLNKASQELKDLMKYIFNVHKSVTKVEVAFSAMILKKAIDIIDTAKYALKKYNITIQISLLRLLCDNCLAIEAAKEVGLSRYIEMVNNGERVSDIIVDPEIEQNMSDGYLKKNVAKDYKGFDKLYNFACESVHFSKQAIANAFIKEDDKVKINIEVGNKNQKEVIIKNNSQMIILTKVIKDMLIKLCL